MDNVELFLGERSEARKNGKMFARVQHFDSHMNIAALQTYPPYPIKKMTDRKAWVLTWDYLGLWREVLTILRCSVFLFMLCLFYLRLFLGTVLYLFPSSSTTALAWYNADP